ncbi:PREDICTED: uncharacterized protein LOC104753613 [Camelina sativa]|uniref:Uncharacterized protein LOC104753613 n=1 Tax=Camelina sativa TaxID=90675 RepID=A0ABM0WPF2_CAMSA|nr:PREDICTED: uncharacterized protein LOC104753613 [Camelina sativa]
MTFLIIAENDDQFQGDTILPSGRRNVSNQERWAIFSALLARSDNGNLNRYHTKEVSDLFSVPIQIVRKIWRRAKETAKDGKVDVSHRRTGNCGRKKIALDVDKVATIPLQKRTTLRTFAVAMDMSLGTLHRRKKEGAIRRHTNPIKPHLKEANLKGRLEFCISMLDKNTLPHEPKFVDMYNIVHIDEKWFYMTKKTAKYYLLLVEDDPHRTCQSKNFIGKVMFLAAMARPRFDEEGNEVFSGKIGIFPFVTLEAAKRRSKNRDAGTLELKASTSVKREDIKACLIEKVLPKIYEKWPREDRGKTIFIQQDNARTHIACSDTDFQEVASRYGFDIQLKSQPPNSPDLNILDLGFFSAIQSLQHKACPKTIKDLVCAVEESFERYPTNHVNRIFLTLQSCMLEIMKVVGSNKYKIPHMKKSTLERNGLLPKQLSCDAMLLEHVLNIPRSSN